MDQNASGDEVVVARVRLALPDGAEETWLVPMRLADDALSYAAAIYPPEGAAVVGIESLRRPAAALREVVIARADLDPV